MNLHNSYFAIKSPFVILDRWLNPFRHSALVQMRGKDIKIQWTKRAENAFKLRTKPLIAEMQLYFSCVVKKRVLFHDASNMEKFNVNNKLAISFRPVQAAACSPEEFADKYPVNNEFDSAAAIRMHPSLLSLDFIDGNWKGEFDI